MNGEPVQRVVMGERIAPEVPEVLRRELADHQKWVFSIGSLLLTLSISLVGLRARSVVWVPVLVAGWLLLASSMFHSWLAIKKLVALAVVRQKTKDELGPKDLLLIATLDKLFWYGTLGNVTLVFGGALLLVGLMAQVSVLSAWLVAGALILYAVVMGPLLKRVLGKPGHPTKPD